ncbi:unnamed protein product [Protopolystoma xenopodis]|uniref:Uncharacterized protein n=1 Tax=Protopolystoma xenopodis TaxID=117903 RepID=A0A3S5CNM0_9PLAT|nr:unnamed protein product [Protopolystoma xenopodis]
MIDSVQRAQHANHHPDSNLEVVKRFCYLLGKSKESFELLKSDLLTKRLRFQARCIIVNLLSKHDALAWTLDLKDTIVQLRHVLLQHGSGTSKTFLSISPWDKILIEAESFCRAVGPIRWHFSTSPLAHTLDSPRELCDWIAYPDFKPKGPLHVVRAIIVGANKNQVLSYSYVLTSGNIYF